MQANAFDMVFMPKEFFSDAPMRTVVDVLGADALREAACLCGCWSPQQDAASSRYELFAAFCRCAPMLTGTRVLLRSQWLLRQLLQIELPLSEEACDSIWRQAAERLQTEPLQWNSFFLREKAPMICCDAAALQKVAKIGTPVLDGNSLLPSAPTTLHDWQAQMTKTAEAFAACGCCGVAVDLPVEDVLKKTDVYHAEEALKKRKRGRDEECCLLFQLMRMLCTICRERGWFLFFQTNGCGRQARSLLEHLERNVGLPQMVWFARKTDAATELLFFFSSPRELPAVAAVVAGELAGERELYSFADALWARYPRACTAFVCHTDIRYFAYERERMRRLSEWMAER